MWFEDNASRPSTLPPCALSSFLLAGALATTANRRADPAIAADVLTFEVHPCADFPRDALQNQNWDARRQRAWMYVVVHALAMISSSRSSVPNWSP